MAKTLMSVYLPLMYILIRKLFPNIRQKTVSKVWHYVSVDRKGNFADKVDAIKG